MRGNSGGFVGGDGGIQNTSSDVSRRSKRRRRVLGGGLLAVLVAVTGAGCVAGTPPYTECPAIGWSNQFDVIVKGPAAAEAAQVTICSEQACTDPSQAANPGPTHDPLYSTTDLGGGRWRIQLGFDAPEQVNISVLGADGSTLTATTADLEWHRVGGSEECGGPHEADAVTVEIP